MSIHFDHSWLLLIGLLAVPIVIIGWQAMSGMDLLRTLLSLGARAALLIAMAVMLASPHVVREHDRLTVIGLLDVSTSVRRFAELPTETDIGDRSVLEYLRQWFRAATDVKAPDDRFGLIVFDGRAAAITTPSTDRSLDDAFSIETIEGTNIADAIQLGLAMFPSDTARRMILVSDGNETVGNALEAARLAAGAADAADPETAGVLRHTTIPIDVLPIAYHIEDDVQVLRVEAPPQAQAAQTITVRIVLDATRATSGRLVLTHEGRLIDLNGAEPGVARAVDVPAGRSVHRAEVRLLDSKVNRFEATFEPDNPADDVLGENNSAEAFTATPAAGKVLIVDDLTGRRENVLAGTLADAEFNIEQAAPIEFPGDLLSMQRYDLIVLDNIPSYALTVEQHDLLARFVNDLGGGLIMLGGEQSFGAGGWNGTSVENILPVELDPPRELRLATAALVLVLDQSGSMNRPVAGARASQQDVANEGAALAVESLRETSYVGVVTFDMFAHEHVPLQRNDNPKAIAARIRAIRADGGTNILPALRMAHRMLAGIDVEKKRVVCLSDGQSPTDGLKQQAQRMADDGINITTIAVGDNADFETLSMLADIGQGAFYEVRNPKILPSVLIDSVQIINKPLIKEGRFTPVIRAGATSLAAGMQSAPPLEGLVITALKESPAVALELAHPDGEPLLAQWQAGLGRVAAFTSSAHAPWGAQWHDWPTAATFWTQLARQTSRPSMTQDTELTARIIDDQLHVRLDVLSDNEAQPDDRPAQTQLSFLTVDGTVYQPNGSSQPIRLRQSGPREYTTSVPAGASGNYIVALTPKRNGRPLAPVIGGTSRTGSPELRRYASNIELLREISEMTGGRILEISDPHAVNVYDRAGLPTSRSFLPVWHTILLAVIALMLLDVANRRVAWSTAGAVSAIRRGFRRSAGGRERVREIAIAVGSLRDRGLATRRTTEFRARSAPVSRPTPSGRAPATVTDRREPADISARDDVVEGQTPSPAPAEKPSQPDRRAVESALEALLGKPSSPREDQPAEGRREDVKSSEPEQRDDRDQRTGSLLDAKRRARERLRQQRGDADKPS